MPPAHHDKSGGKGHQGKRTNVDPRSAAYGKGQVEKRDRRRAETKRDMSNERKNTMKTIGSTTHRRVHKNFIVRGIDSAMFEAVVTVLACIHCIMLAFWMNCRSKQPPNFDAEEACSETAQKVWMAITLMFLALAVVEWCLRLYAFGVSSFRDMAFLMDSATIWGFGVVMYLIVVIAGNDEIAWLQSLQVFRILRVMRNVKIVGQNKYFKGIWLLIRGMVASIRTLVCSAILIAVTIYCFAVVGTGIIGHANKTSWTDRSAVVYAERFDSLFTSILTLIRILFSDGSFDIMLAIGEEFWAIHIYFMLFIGIAVFVVTNLIVAVIVENALHITASDEEFRAHEKQLAKQQLMERLIDIFQELDKDDSGFITFEEFINSFKVEQMKYMLQSLDFDEKDLIELFKTLDDENVGCLNLDEFMIRMGRLTEDPTAKDFLSLQKLAQSCMDLAKIVAADQKATTGNTETAWYEESGLKILKLSAEMDDLNTTLVQLKPRWVDRMNNYGPAR